MPADGSPSDQASLAAFLLGGGALRRKDWEDAPTTPAPPQRRIDWFQIEEPLGRGGMGVVYRAKDLKRRTTVALKLLAPQGRIGHGAKRLELEAFAAARIDHPAIVRLLHVGELDDVPYLVMEYVRGRTLAERLQEGPLALREAAELTRTLAEALHAAHQQRVLHRDVKPSNVMLTPEGRPVLTDFGLAKLLDRAGELTRTGQLLGTPEYMAPEQALAASKVDRRADVYGLGATLYAMLTCEPPFSEGAVMDTVLAVIAGDLEPPSSLRPEIDGQLEAICLRAMHKDPERRYLLLPHVDRMPRG